MENFKYYELLGTQYKDTHSIITEMINLKALINLPKGTEHFVSDIHGEYDAFYHIIQNASGAIRMYIEDIFGLSMSQEDKKNLALLIYYPKERLDILEQKMRNYVVILKLNRKKKTNYNLKSQLAFCISTKQVTT